MNKKLDAGEVRTVVDLADHIERMRQTATTLQQTFGTGDRGFFTPSEDDQVGHLWVSYHMARAALLESIDSVRKRVGKASGEYAGEFAVAYAAALILVYAARCLRDLFGDDPIVRRKLNESYSLYGIREGSFDEIQLSLTDPTNALGIRKANQFYDEHRELLMRLADEDEGLRAVLGVIEAFGDSVRVSTARYLRARAVECGRDAKERIVQGSVLRAVYIIQEWGSRLVSNISTMPNHVPRLPDDIAHRVTAILVPGDVLITRKDSAVTNYFLPGFWPHAALYIGEGRVIESLKDGVRERSMDSPMGNDAIAIVRPRLEASMVEEAIRRAWTHVGKPYDFDFDFTRADRIVCTEVVYRSYEGVGDVCFQLKRRAGRQTLSAEDLLNLALRHENFDPVAVYCARCSNQLLDGDAMKDVLRKTMAQPMDG